MEAPPRFRLSPASVPRRDYDRPSERDGIDARLEGRRVAADFNGDVHAAPLRQLAHGSTRSSPTFMGVIFSASSSGGFPAPVMQVGGHDQLLRPRSFRRSIVIKRPTTPWPATSTASPRRGWASRTTVTAVSRFAAEDTMSAARPAGNRMGIGPYDYSVWCGWWTKTSRPARSRRTLADFDDPPDTRITELDRQAEVRRRRWGGPARDRVARAADRRASRCRR